jgi:hypothetical protein
LEGGTDTVVTFNYDRVLDVLGEYLIEHFGTTRFAVKLPDANPGDAGGIARVLKLHGSVDWLRTNPKQFSAADRDCAVKSTNIENLAIATPGASKRSLVDELAPLWDAAHDAIVNATRIVIIGYRLPETDAYARKQILSAIRSNTHGPDIEVVLGPETHHVDCVRLTTLLEYAKPDNGRVVAVPLFGQDFLDVSANK